MRSPDEFKALLQTYGDMAYRMAYQLTGGRESEASDLVQEVFVKIWRSWDQQARPASVKGWMYRVLRNLYLDSLRRRSRAKESPMPEEDVLNDPGASFEMDLERFERRHQVAAALARLENDFRLPVMLCDMEGLAYEDIARILQCPVGTVRSRIHRGRERLRQWLRLNASEVCL